jgi:hypothetical protein
MGDSTQTFSISAQDIDEALQSLSTKNIGEFVLEIRKVAGSVPRAIGMVHAYTQLLSPAIQPTVEKWIDVYSGVSQSPDFWRMRGDHAFRGLERHADAHLKSWGVATTAESTFLLVMVLIHNFVYITLSAPEGKEFIQKSIGVGLFRRLFD